MKRNFKFYFGVILFSLILEGCASGTASSPEKQMTDPQLKSLLEAGKDLKLGGSGHGYQGQLTLNPDGTKIGGSVSNPVGGSVGDSIGGSEICVGSDCFVVEFANLGEDSSEPARRGRDTCNGTQNRYDCPPDVERTCLDRYTGEHEGDWGGPPTVYKTVTCVINKRLVYKMP